MLKPKQTYKLSLQRKIGFWYLKGQKSMKKKDKNSKNFEKKQIFLKIFY